MNLQFHNAHLSSTFTGGFPVVYRWRLIRNKTSRPRGGLRRDQKTCPNWMMIVMNPKRSIMFVLHVSISYFFEITIMLFHNYERRTLTRAIGAWHTTPTRRSWVIIPQKTILVSFWYVTDNIFDISYLSHNYSYESQLSCYHKSRSCTCLSSFI